MLQAKSCNKNIYKTSDTIYTVDTHYISSIEYKPGIRTVDTFKRIDTVTQLHLVAIDFYSKKYYIDTIVDSLGVLAIVKDTIFKNEILSRSVDFRKIDTISTIINTIVEEKKDYFGVGVLYNQGLIPTVSYTKNKWTYLGGYNISNKSINFGVIYNLR